MKLSSRPLNIMKVIDSRYDQSSIGWVLRGGSSIRKTANFEKPFIEEIHDFLISNLTIDTTEVPLIVEILHLEITEPRSTSNRAKTHLSIRFIIEQNSEYYNLLEVNEIVEVNSIDVTGKHDKNIAQAFRQCFGRLHGLNFSKTDELKKIPLASISGNFSNPEANSHSEFLKDRIHGIYHNFNEFRDNTPDDTREFYVEKNERKSEKWKGTYNVIPRFSTSNKKIKDIWGFCISDKVYVYHQVEFFPLTINDDGLNFYGYGIIDLSEVGETGAMFGAVGASLAYSSNMKKAKNQKIRYFIDPVTGKIGTGSEVPVSFDDQEGKKAKLILYRRSKGESNLELTLTIDGYSPQSFVPYSYVEIDFVMPVNPIEICLNENCQQVIPSPEKTKYLECTFPKRKNSSPQISLVTQEIGEFYSTQAKHYQEKRLKSNQNH